MAVLMLGSAGLIGVDTASALDSWRVDATAQYDAADRLVAATNALGQTAEFE